MSTDQHKSVWFHLYEDREKAAALELHSTLLLELERLLDSDTSVRSKIDSRHLSAIDSGRILEVTTSSVALLVHDLGYKIEVKLVPGDLDKNRKRKQ